MSVINANPLMLGDAGYNIGRSLRFRSSASAYLNRTPASSSSRTTWTWSGWVKRGALSSAQGLFAAYSAATDAGKTELIFLSDNIYLGGGATVWATTTQVFRDPSAWYHIILSVDTTQATNTNRWKLYVNGSQVTAFSTANYPAQNATWAVNSNTAHYCGASYAGGVAYYLDGYQAEVNFIDGQALTPSSFGQTDAVTGVWVPKKYTSTYGTNGFYLPFSDNTSATTLAYDKSGNGNNWTPNNISTTAGSTYDSMLDVPTLTSATAANYCVLSPINRLSGTAGNISDGNLKQSGASNYLGAGSFQIPTTGKWYWEASLSSAQYPLIGLAKSNAAGGGSYAGWFGAYYNGAAYDVFYNSSYTDTGNQNGFCTTSGDVFLCCIDSDNNKVWLGRSRSGTVTWIGSGDPSTGTNPTFSGSGGGGVYSTAFDITAGYYPTVSSGGGSDTWVANFGAGSGFTYTPPTGFKALNTFNLPDPTIKKPNQYMTATLWTGDGTNNRAITGVGFAPDLVWIKNRSAAESHNINDTVRGTGKWLLSNGTNAERTDYGCVQAFGSDGFTIGYTSGDNNNINGNGNAIVSWNWKESATAGFDIVTYTGTGTNTTVAHNLGVAPKMIIVKGRNTAYNWPTYHAMLNGGSSPQNYYVYLNTTNAQAAYAAHWNNTAPTSSVFSLGTDASVNGSTNTYVAYLFAEIAGFSKFGSYTGNGSTDGPFVYCGFRPKYVMVKRTDVANWWQIYDSSRSPYNVADKFLAAQTSDAEYTATSPNDLLDFVSNGIKVRGSNNAVDANGGTYIFMAFAENPFKYSNAR